MNDELVDFREFFLIIWRRKLLVVGLCLATSAVALALALKSVPYYRSVSKMICKTSKGGDAELAGIAALAGLKLRGGQTSDPSAYFVDVINDDEFMEKILSRKWPYKGDSLMLHDVWEIRPDSTKPDWEKRFRQKRLDRLRDGNYIELKQNPNGLLVLITLFEDPMLARDVNRFIVGQLNDYVITGVVTQAKENRKFIESQIRGLEDSLNRSENALVRFRQRNMGVQAPDLLAEEMRLKRDVTLNQEMFIQMKKQLELARIEENKDQPVIEVISKAVAPVDKFKPSKRKMVVVGAIGGLILGLMAAFLLHWAQGVRELDRSRRTA